MKRTFQFIRKITGIRVALSFLWALIVLLACAFVFVFLVLLKPNWFNFQPSFGQNVSTLAMMLTALATLMLATATFMLIRHSKEQEERRREAELLKEKRDQVRVWLAISQNWATSISERLDKDIAYYFATPQRLKTLTNIFMIPATDKTSILTIVEKTPDAELARILKEAVRSFDQLLVSLSNVKLSRDSLNKERKLVEKRMEECRSAMYHVLRRVKEIKTLLLLE